MSRVTISDVARAAGVSVATVSKVLNARDGVAPSTSTHVMSVIEQLGYESSLVARGMRSRRTHVIGILAGEFEPFSSEIFKGAAAALSDTGYELLAYTSGVRGGGAGWERRFLSRLSGTLIDGAVLVTPATAPVDVDVPVVAIDAAAGPSGQPGVDSDSLGGAMLATEHLLGLGHRRIGFIGGRPDLYHWSRVREHGFRTAMAAAGVRVDESLLLTDDYGRGSVVAALRALLSREDRPTAIFAAYDVSAIAAVDVARDLGLRVPDDLSVVGFSDIPESAQTDPPLTTVSQSIQEMGAAAVRLLTGLLDGAAPDEAHVRLATSLVLRRSTSAPR
ncbi:LacI family DNA-binding transcriptional regulator [Cellulomonas sp.]|uniref:LacI family DNA-binding transcriptional regulator n=1 Tax=Cellulomonas sp. TaxID=40001 RepID=UPI001AFE0751|nr:LacI family DNA-binding transcriptional regulator [Cellulomonas sp.]MBO9556263.1 LacI family DNA-binding transcriptional regulator [Cellulomonas sp.]